MKMHLSVDFPPISKLSIIPLYTANNQNQRVTAMQTKQHLFQLLFSKLLWEATFLGKMHAGFETVDVLDTALRIIPASKPFIFAIKRPFPKGNQLTT